MSTITVMRSNFEGTTWKRAFAESLLQLCPDMNPDAADEVSDVEFVRSKDLDPGVAALRWFDRRLPRENDDPTVSTG